jgi:hypothetical protein
MKGQSHPSVSRRKLDFVKNFSNRRAGELTSGDGARYNTCEDGSCDRPTVRLRLPPKRETTRPVDSPEPRDSTSVGILWASRITAVGLEFVLPAVVGLFLDRTWSLGPLGVIAGVVIGFAIGMAHLLRISREGAGAKR